MIDNLKNQINNSKEINNFDYTNNLTGNNNIKFNDKEQNSLNLSEKNNITKKPENKIKKISTEVLNFMLAIVSVVTLSLTGVVDALIPSKATVQAEIVWIETSEDSVYYYVELFDPELDEDQGKDYSREEYINYFKDCYVFVYNDFTNRSQHIEEMYFQGYEENLKPNMTYTIEVRKGNIVLAQKTFRIQLYEDSYDEPDDETYDDQDDEPYDDPDYDPTTGRPNVSDDVGDDGTDDGRTDNTSGRQ